MSETISNTIYYHFLWKKGKTYTLTPSIFSFLDNPEEDIYDCEDGKPIE